MTRVEAPSKNIVVRHCEGLEEFEACLQMERLVWDSQDIDVVPTAIFVVVKETGGQVLGAFDLDAGGKMVGFTLAMAAFHGSRRYLHSHMTAVLAEYRNLGVGRMLKLIQRQDAQERGIGLVEWTFDPMELRNAHFNLVRLGAVVRRYLPNVYGITTSPLHGGMPTDRLVAEWWLDSPRVAARADQTAPKQPASAERAVRKIEVPRNLEEIRKRSVSEAIHTQARIREEFQSAFDQGLIVTGIEFSREKGSYLLEANANPENLPA